MFEFRRRGAVFRRLGTGGDLPDEVYGRVGVGFGAGEEAGGCGGGERLLKVDVGSTVGNVGGL